MSTNNGASDEELTVQDYVHHTRQAGRTPSYQEYVEIRRRRLDSSVLTPERVAEIRQRLRVQRGASEGIQRPSFSIHRQPREGDGVPEFEIQEDHYPADNVHEGVIELFSKGEIANELWKLGIDRVILHTTRHGSTSTEKYLNELEFHIFPGRVPSDVSHMSVKESAILAEFNVVYEFVGDQMHSFATGRTGSERYEFDDEKHDSIGLAHKNYLMIYNDILANMNNQVEIFSYVLRKWFKCIAGEESIPCISLSDFEELNSNEVSELFKKAFSEITQDSLSEETRGQARGIVRDAFRLYQLRVREYEDQLRFLDSSLEPEDIAKRAVATAEALAHNPLVTGCRSVGDNIQVLTRPVPSDKYWSGVKRLLISLPVYFRGSYDDIFVHEFTPRGLRNLPVKELYIYADGTICFGSLSNSIDMNLLTGEWNMALLLILRGLMGRENLRVYTKRYSDMIKASVEVSESGKEQKES